MPTCYFQAIIACPTNATGDIPGNDNDARIGCLQAPRDAEGIVPRAIIDNDNFQRDTGLAQCRVNRTPERAFGIVGGHYDRDVGAID